MRGKVCAGLVLAISAAQMLSLLKIYDFKPLIALMGISLLFFTYAMMSDGFKKMTVVFLLLGAAMNIYSRQGLSSWVDGANYMLTIAGILAIMQLFTIPIKLSDYGVSLQYLILRNFKNERTLFIFTMLVGHLFASFLLFGTVPVMVSLMSEPLSKIVKDYKRFAGTAFSRGQAMVGIWAPGAVNMLLAISATGAAWSEVFFMGLALAALGLTISYFVQLPYLSDERLSAAGVDDMDDSRMAGKAYAKIGFIVFLALVLILMIMLFDYLKIGNNTSQVMLSCLILSSCWLAFFFKHPGFKAAVSEYVNVGLVKTADLAVLYASLGFFSKALENSGALQHIAPYVAMMAESTGVFLLPIISVIVFLLSFTGLHPFIILVFLGKMLTSFHTAFSPAIITMALLAGAAPAYTISPFAGIVLTAAKYLDVSVYEVGFKWNRVFSLWYFFLGSSFIMLLALLLK